MDVDDPDRTGQGERRDAGRSMPGEETGMDLQAHFVDFAEAEPASHHEARGAPPLRGALLKLLLLPFAFVFFLTILFLAMRGVLDLGGMVAVGGPYEIAHPAPGYWWIFPISIIACVVIALASLGVFSMPRAATAANYGPFGGMWNLTQGGGEVSLVAIFFWPAIFLSLGWNFCEYGFFKMESLAWGWVICGIVFVFMGGIPIYILLRKVSARELLEAVRSNFGAIWPQLLAIAAAVPLGVLFFRAVS